MCESFINKNLLHISLTKFKGILMQIWKPAIIVFFIWKYGEDFILKHILVLYEICTREIYEKFGYKHSETIE